MAGGVGYGERSLKETPTWAVALVCAVFVIISVIIEHGIHSLAQWFQKRQKKAMSEALEKIKSELMLLGFISLLITIGTKPISKICIPEKAGNIMLPCKNGAKNDDEKDNDGRKLLWYAGDAMWRRVLAPASGDDYCSKHDKVALVSQSGVHQLHIFIFMLAVFHVLYSVVTIALAKAKMKKWKKWEAETTSLEYEFNNDPSRFRFTRQTSFVRRHTGFSTTPGLRWIVAFFRQFFASVTKVDYLTMRHGFINAHFAPNSKFNFHKYIKRSMEDDFKVVVGISIPLWTCSIVFQLLNVNGLYTLLWIQFIPLLIVVIVGTKLEIIIMEMAQHIQDKTSVVKGAPVVEPSNKYFWFNRPDIILFLIHFTLFQNAFQMAYFLWIWYEFGLKSCFHENLPEILTRVILGVALQFLCSYITFPLYALVTQMGSHMKKAIFEEQTAKALKKWQKAARERNKLRKPTATAEVSTGFMSPDQTSTPSRGTSPMHLLHKYKNNYSVELESVVTSPRASCHSETEMSETEGPSPSSTSRDAHEPRRENHPRGIVESHNDDFSFANH
ncbi:MLO protein homolog 1 [Manihot esculenta]|uniref:MLO-like protein n=1 Tax=Manihot esculenta TaxID=3983 RepID=A0A2C9WL29_MANES|nr:MLO protein homolog 1 [Manihot esculenta]OAY61010.1 hypothetical protein MANES_01G156700v8 [Manihot esculenta]